MPLVVTQMFRRKYSDGFSARPDGASREEIRDYLSGNLCRCSGYQTIIDGVELVMSRRSAQPAGGAEAEVTA